MVIRNITRSKRGLPCLWEKGGGFTNTGYVTIIAGKDGSAKKPIYIRTRGSLACEEHALIPIQIGDHVIEVDRHRSDLVISIYRITNILQEEAELQKINEFSQGEWDQPLPDHLVPAVEAAEDKSYCYHCRSPHYIQE